MYSTEIADQLNMYLSYVTEFGYTGQYRKSCCQCIATRYELIPLLCYSGK